MDKRPQEQTQQEQPVNQPTEKKGNLNEQKLMQKTLLELKEVQARGRKTMIKTKYVRKDRNKAPPPKEKSKEELELEEALKAKEIKAAQQHITCSAPYYDDTYEYKHVVLPKNMVKYIPSGLLKPQQWYGLGIRQSSSWEHYMVYEPEPHILLFRRSKDYSAKRQAEKELADRENKKLKAEVTTTDTENAVASNISNIPPANRSLKFVHNRTLR